MCETGKYQRPGGVTGQPGLVPNDYQLIARVK